jgi:hypothetical protein
VSCVLRGREGGEEGAQTGCRSGLLGGWSIGYFFRLCSPLEVGRVEGGKGEGGGGGECVKKTQHRVNRDLVHVSKETQCRVKRDLAKNCMEYVLYMEFDL